MNVDVDPLVKSYLAAYPDEAARLKPFQQFLAETPADLRWRRSTSAGHLTASGIVLDLMKRRVLLIHHAALDRWLQPGGHIEAGDASLAAAAVREVTEETGLPPSALTPFRTNGDAAVPFDIDSHHIPARPSKGEGPHTHHDFRYVFTANSETPMTHDAVEVHAAKWCELSTLADRADFGELLAKVQRLL